MPQFNKILCPIDFSEATDSIAKYCNEMASKLGAEVVVLYVAPRMNRYAELYVAQEDLAKVVNSIVAGAKEKMEVCVETYFKDVKATGKIKVGYAPEEILNSITTDDADLVVMGTHGRRGINLILFGSVAEQVVKKSPVPVVTVRPI